MNALRTLRDSAGLYKLGYILVWVQAALGGVLLVQCWPPLTHGIFAVLLAAALLCIHAAGKRRSARVTARVIVSLFWLLALLLTVQTVDAVLQGFTDEHVIVLQDGIGWFGGLFLCYLSPAATTVMLYSGENAAGYDRLMACLYQPVLILAAYVTVFTDAGIPWTLDGKVLPYIWLALTVIATVVVWICARQSAKSAPRASQKK